MDWLEGLYRVEMPNFIDVNFDSVIDLLRPWRAGIQLARAQGNAHALGELESALALC